MQNNKNYSEIQDLITTKESLIYLNQELELLASSLYEVKNGNFEEVLSKIRNTTASLIRKFVINEDKETLIKNLQGELKKVKFLEITLSEEPSEKLLENILNWLKNKIDQKIALDIKIDRAIIGGATFSFDGKFFDGSILHKLETVLKNYGQ